MKAKVCKTQPASILDLKQRILQQGYSWGNGGVVPPPRAEEATARQNEYLNEKHDFLCSTNFRLFRQIQRIQ